MNKAIQLLTVAAALAAGAHEAQATAPNQCDITIPANGDLNDVPCATQQGFNGRLKLDDPANGPGVNYSYTVSLQTGTLIAGVLLDGNGLRTARSAATGGGSCLRISDDTADGAFKSPSQTCNLATPDSAKVYRGAITNF